MTRFPWNWRAGTPGCPPMAPSSQTAAGLSLGLSVRVMILVSTFFSPLLLGAQGNLETDSAGVRITENRVPRLSEVLVLTGPPIAEIGGAEGRDGADLSVILSAALLPGDRFAVVDLYGREIRIFDEDARHVRSIGRAGEGPGEFGAAPTIRSTAEGQLWAWDPGNRRLSRFAIDGELLEEFRFAPNLLQGVPSAFTLNAWQVSTSGLVLSMASVPRRPGAPVRQARLLDHNSRAPVLVGREWEVVQVRDGSLYLPSPFESTLVGTFIGGRIMLSRPGAWELAVYEPDGLLVQRIRSAVPRTEVGSDLAGSARAGLEEWYPADPQFARMLDRVQLPDSTSAISRIIASEEGETVWVLRWQLWTPPRGLYSDRWYDVIDQRGRWIQTVRVPTSAGAVEAVRGERVLTVFHDELGVPYVRVYRVANAATSR